MKSAICILSAIVVTVLSTSSANAQSMSMSNMNLTNDAVYDYEAYIGMPKQVWGYHLKVYKSSGVPEWYGPFSSSNLMANWMMNMVDQGRADDWIITESFQGYRSIVLDWLLEGRYNTRQEAEDAIAIYRPLGKFWRTKIERVNEMSYRRRR